MSVQGPVPQNFDDFIKQAAEGTAKTMLSLSEHLGNSDVNELYRSAFHHTLQNNQNLIQFLHQTVQDIAKTGHPERASNDTVLQADFTKVNDASKAKEISNQAKAEWAKFDQSMGSTPNPFSQIENGDDLKSDLDSKNTDKLQNKLENRMLNQFKMAFKNKPSLQQEYVNKLKNDFTPKTPRLTMT